MKPSEKIKSHVVPTIAAGRAVGAEFARRMLKPLIIIGAIIALLAVGGVGWLTTINPWWWVVEVPMIIGAFLFIAVVIGVRIALRLVDPTQTSAQKTAVVKYVDQLQRVADNVQTPQFVIAYRIVRDTIRPRQGGFVETVSRDSKTLAPDFLILVALFK